jgi:hypothetical protein
MTTELTDNNFDGIGAADTPDGLVETGDDGVSTATDNGADADLDTVDVDSYLASAPESIREELRARTLMQADYTRKMQALADKRREFDQLIELAKQRGPAAEQAPAAEPEWTAERAKAEPLKYFEHLAQSRADAAVKAAEGRIRDQVMAELGPVAHEAKLRKAAANVFAEDPSLAARSEQLLPYVEQALSGNAALADLARTSPEQAVKIALSMAGIQSEAQATSARLAKLQSAMKRKSDIAPPAARNGSPVTNNLDEMSLEEAAVAAFNGTLPA